MGFVSFADWHNLGKENPVNWRVTIFGSFSDTPASIQDDWYDAEFPETAPVAVEAARVAARVAAAAVAQSAAALDLAAAPFAAASAADPAASVAEPAAAVAAAPVAQSAALEISLVGFSVLKYK